MPAAQRGAKSQSRATAGLAETKKSVSAHKDCKCCSPRPVCCANSGPQFSIANAQKVLPLPKFALETHALGDLKCRDDATVDLFAALARALAD
jgi:hypothetical protein